MLEKILRVKEYVDEHYRESLSIDEAAGVAHISRSHFSECFKRITGYSFIDYCNYVKVERAKELLVDEGLSIKDVASTLGYNNVSYFIKVFRKFNACSPVEFRKGLAL